MNRRTLISWILAVLLAVGFLLAALGKLTGAATEMFAAWGYPEWFVYAIGVVELVGAIGLLVPRATTCAVYLLTAVMLGAIATHLMAGETAQVARPIVFLALLWALWKVRRQEPAAA